MENYDYIINAGKSQDECEPVAAAPNKEKAIESAQLLLMQCGHNYAEVVFMPENDVNTNEVIWTSEEVFK